MCWQSRRPRCEIFLAVATTLPGYRGMRELVGPRDNVVSPAASIRSIRMKSTMLKSCASWRRKSCRDGETGLDYFYTPETKPRQQASFRDHIRIGRELNKPVIVHTRDARADTLAILRKKK
jgi:TatD DNase family protein